MLIGGTLLVASATWLRGGPDARDRLRGRDRRGIGNGIQWPSLISAVQQLTPAALHGRLMSAVGSLKCAVPAIGFILGGSIAALSSPRAAMAVAGIVATLATVAFLRSAHQRAAHGNGRAAGRHERAEPGDHDPVDEVTRGSRVNAGR